MINWFFSWYYFFLSSSKVRHLKLLNDFKQEQKIKRKQHLNHVCAFFKRMLRILGFLWMASCFIYIYLYLDVNDIFVYILILYRSFICFYTEENLASMLCLTTIWGYWKGDNFFPPLCSVQFQCSGWYFTQYVLFRTTCVLSWCKLV